MRALSFIPVRPVAVQQIFGHVRFHRILFVFFVALLVARIVVILRTRRAVDAIWKHRRRKQNGLAVRRPFHNVGAGGKFRQWMRFTAFHGKEIDLRIAASR
jgi:hypothetical protein